MPDFWQALTSMADGRASRGSAMHPILALVSTLAIVLLGAIWLKAPTWLLICVLSLVGVAVLITLATFCVFMSKDPDAIRSEKYHLRKLEIEQGAIGDNISGILDPARQPRPSLEARREDVGNG